ncbi:MAG: hypothetical protein OXG18_05535 [Gemmatimonadetes bacterium]|nr:hypothetical protein [Gemmatimonadota bacterium]
MDIMHRDPAIGVRLFALLPLALAACDPAPESSLTARSDSAGISITTALAPLWGPSEGWTIGDEPMVEIGEVSGPAEYLLDGVTGAVRLSDGGIVLGERSSGELRRYDREGTFAWRAAGPGEGPGEHQRLRFLFRLLGDSVVTWDIALGRVQVFGPDGRFARSSRIESPWAGLTARGVIGASDRHLVLTFSDYRGAPVGNVRWPGVRIAIYSLDDGTVRELMSVPGAERNIERYGEQIAYTSYEFGKGPRWAIRPGQLAIVDTESFSVRSISLPDGATTAILRRDMPVREVTSEHVEAFVEQMAHQNIVYNGYSEEQAEASKPGWRKHPMASTLPVLESILLDAAGNLWVEPHTVYGAAKPPPDVYAPDGTWLGTVALPSGRGGLSASGGLEIGDDYVLGVWRDEQGVEYVRMYALEK